MLYGVVQNYPFHLSRVRTLPCDVAGDKIVTKKNIIFCNSARCYINHSTLKLHAKLDSHCQQLLKLN